MKRLLSLLLPAALLAACSDTPAPAGPGSPLPERSAQIGAPIGDVIPDQYIVVFKSGVARSGDGTATFARAVAAKVERRYDHALRGVALKLTPTELAAMRANPAVAYVEQDRRVTLTATQPSAPWGLDRIDQQALPLNTTYVYNADGTGVTVYIIDTGINLTHTQFTGRVVTGYDAVTAGGTAADCDGHGSHVSGTVGGTTYGVAKNVSLVAVRVLDCFGNGTVSGVIAGINWVAAHRVLPAVANMSLGGGFSSALNLAVSNAIGTGVTFVVAAGNSTADACLESPSSEPLAITVGATSITDGFAGYSNRGLCVDINAPGSSITSAYIGSNTATNVLSGTSMASPHVAGAAALYLQGHPTATPAQVGAALISNATTGVITGLPANTTGRLLYTGFIGGPPVNQAPTATIVAPANGASVTAGTTVTFNGSGSDFEDGALTGAALQWTSSRDGIIGSGTTFTKANLSVGTHTITLTATDAQLATGTATRTLTVTAAPPVNQPPVANFTMSCPTLHCTVDGSASTDDAGIVSYSWVWGNGKSKVTPTGITSTTYYANAVYTVSLTVTDAGGLTNTITKQVTVPTVTPPPNQAPTASITAPANGTSVVSGTAVTFSGGGTDPEDGVLGGTSLQWTSSRDGAIGSGASFTKSNLTVGAHTITLTATDAQGATGTSTRTLTVTPPPNQAPTASITAPANGTSVVSGTAVTFSGGGTDPEDGALGGTSLQWTSSRDGAIGSGASFTKANLSVGTHTITLTVTDAQGATGTATRSLTVTAAPPVNQPPVADFTWSCGTPTAKNCAFNASSSTDDVGIVSYAWNWGNGKAKTTLTPTTTTTFYVAGPTTVTLTVTDAGGLTSTITKVVTIQ
jgi:subtilisin family serine protease